MAWKLAPHLPTEHVLIENKNSNLFSVCMKTNKKQVDLIKRSLLLYKKINYTLTLHVSLTIFALFRIHPTLLNLRFIISVSTLLLTPTSNLLFHILTYFQYFLQETFKLSNKIISISITL